MLNDLEELVNKLHECLSASGNAEECRAIVSDIICCLDENMNAQTISKFTIFLEIWSLKQVQ